MNAIKNNLKNIQKTMADCEKTYQRSPNSVKLLAASKGQSATRIRMAALAGQTLFGENYLQEALEKIQALRDLNLEWHFIGHVQANKTRKIAENFSWVHSVCHAKIAERLNHQRPDTLPVLNICIEVNIDNEPNKPGISLAELLKLASFIINLPRLKLRGLMAMPKPCLEIIEQRASFAKLRLALENLQRQGLTLDTLSMGISSDFKAAIAEGATIVRIGTAIFGQREK